MRSTCSLDCDERRRRLHHRLESCRRIALGDRFWPLALPGLCRRSPCLP
eukprot:SAG11_NODE_13934_length_632_cov_2.060038_1_plen_48_part_01